MKVGRKYLRSSYKNKLKMTYTVVMFLMLAVMSGVILYQMYNIVIPQTEDLGGNIIESKAQLLGEWMGFHYDTIDNLANNRIIRSGSITEIQEELDYQNVFLDEEYVGIQYRDGNHFYSTAGREVSNAFDEYSSLADGEIDVMLSSLQTIEATGDRVLVLSQSVYEMNGDFKGVITVPIKIDRIVKEAQSLSMGEENLYWLFDSDGKVIEGKNKKMVGMAYDDLHAHGMRGIEFLNLESEDMTGFATVVHPDGDEGIVLYSEIPNTDGWILAISIFHTEFTNAFMNILIGVGGFVISMSLFIFFIGNRVSNFVAKPLTQIVEIIGSFNSFNDIVMPESLKGQGDEIGVLAQTIDNMAMKIRANVSVLSDKNQMLNEEIKTRIETEDELKDLNESLEIRVQERTEKLYNVTKELQISEERFQFAMQASHVGLWDIDFEHDEAFFSDEYKKLLGIIEGEETLTKDNWMDYIYDDEVSHVRALFNEHMDGERVEFYTEYRTRNSSGTEIWVLASGMVISRDEIGKPLRFIGTLIDITAQKAIENELKVAKEVADEANMSKSQFLANMSHEIRTPMNAIIGLTHLIRQSDMSENQNNYLKKIDEASKTLLRIINDILDFSKIEAGKLNMEKINFNLEKVMENLSNLLTIRATNKGLEMNFDIHERIPKVMIGDPLRLEQILMNLSTNAIKFTEKGEIYIKAEVADENEEKVCLKFTVKDTGIGLTEDQIAKLFTAFTQADGSTTRKYGGTGLGLAISKQLTEMMNGEIWVKSEVGIGSEFFFTAEFDLPEVLEKREFIPVPDLRGIRAIIVDDNKTSLDILKRMLESFTFEVDTFTNSHEAMKAMEQIDYKLLLLDWNMPDMDGIETYKRILANQRIKRPKTIFVSAYGRESLFKQASQLGIENFLMKPVNQSLLFDTVMSTFSETLEPASKELVQISGEEDYKATLQGKKILLVEDNEINQLVARDILNRVGINVTVAGNGLEAVKSVKANKFDLVLMDVQMPVMDGYEATTTIRYDIGFDELPIVAMTANALKGDREQSLKVGMNDYISKPINPDKLYDTLNKWLASGDAKGSEKKELRTLKVLDFVSAKSRLGGNEELLVEIMIKFVEQFESAYDKIFTLIKDNKIDEAKLLVHTIKGVAGNISAQSMYQECVELEAALAGDVELEPLLDEFRKIMEVTVYEIRKRVIDDEETEVVSGEFNSQRASALLDEMKVVLEKARAKEVKRLSGELNTLAWSDECRPVVERLLTQSGKYRFKDALKAVSELRSMIEG